MQKQMTATSITPGGESKAGASGGATAQPILPNAGYSWHICSYARLQSCLWCPSGKVLIFAEDQAEPISMDCTATIVSSTFGLMNSAGGAMAQLDFGALHYGDGKKLTFSVLNNGPKPARFFAACGTPQQLAEDTDATAIRDDPMTAFIQVVQSPQLKVKACNAH